ncbi:MAG: ATP-binding protein [Terracidiphilus sp.]|jgi:two-component system sensor histidine kinase KdpD
MNIAKLLEARNHTTRGQLIGETLAGCWVIALLTFTGYVLHFNPAPVGFLFLLVVVCESILCGFWQASVVSILACLSLDYFFYPPLFHFTVNDPQDWVALGSFELSALLVSRLSSREQITSREAQLQRTAMEQLYELSRSTLLINLHQAPGPQLTQLIQRIFAAEGVAIFDVSSGQCELAGTWAESEGNLAKECYLAQADDENHATHTYRRLLRVGNDSIGAIAIRGNLGRLVLDALASLTAVTLDRCVVFAKESEVEAAHQSERLRAAVLDSLAHAVKTPLTAIQAATAGVSELGKLNNAQEELLALVEDEASKLSLLSTRLLQTAQLEAEEMSVARDEIVVRDLVKNVLDEQRGRMSGHPVEVAVLDATLTLRGDRDLLSMALTQFLDNAAKYSFDGTRVKVSAWESHAEVMLTVHNSGPAIPLADRERIFQRFYRSEGTRHLAPGTGIGLSTVMMAAEAHHGHVWVISNAEEGTTFYLSLPQNGGNGQ